MFNYFNLKIALLSFSLGNIYGNVVFPLQKISTKIFLRKSVALQLFHAIAPLEFHFYWLFDAHSLLWNIWHSLTFDHIRQAC